MVFFNSRKDKLNNLVEGIVSCIDRRKKYNLIIFTCYISNDIKYMDSFFDEISNFVKLCDIRIYVDARDCIRVGVDEIIAYENSFNSKGKSLKFIAVDTPTLFHTKAYCVLSVDETVGALAVGSANFSISGIFSSNKGNYETLLLTNNIETIHSFLNLEEIEKHSKDLIDLLVYKKESFSFKYAVLNQGRFVHKWNENLNQYFATRYNLSERGKHISTSDALKSLGFGGDSETISRQFFDFKKSEIDGDVFDSLLRDGIETYIGYWVPLPLLRGIDKLRNVNDIFQEVSDSFNAQLKDKKYEIEHTFNALKNEGIISESELEKDPIQKLLTKLSKISDDQDRLHRLWYRFIDFDLPYNSVQKKEIESLYDDLVSRSFGRRRKNKAAHSIIRAISTLRPSDISNYFD